MAETCVTFTYGDTVLQIRSADFSDTREVNRTQARSRTHDGLLVVGDKELTILRFYLTWNGLTDTVRDSFEDFFGSSKVNGSMNTFTYTDHFGVENRVRLINDIESYINTFTNLWTVDLVLEVVQETGS